MAVSDLLGVHVRGEKQNQNSGPQIARKLNWKFTIFFTFTTFSGKGQWNELEIQNYEEHIKRKHAQCPDGVKKQLNIRNIVFGAPTSIGGAQLQFVFP